MLKVATLVVSSLKQELTDFSVWWASGLSFQIALMAVLGIVAKLRVPYAHTSLEIIKMRYGKYAHCEPSQYRVPNLVSCGVRPHTVLEG